MILPTEGSLLPEMVATAAMPPETCSTGRAEAVISATTAGDAGLEATNHRVGFHACGDLLQAGLEDRFGKHGRGGGAVTGIITGLAGRFADEASADVLDLVLEFDLLGDAHAVLGDRWVRPNSCR